MTIEISSCKVFLQPGEVDAGGVITLSAEVGCIPAHDLSGRPLQVRDHTGALVETIPFTAFDGEVSTTAQATVRAPEEPGSYTWSATVAEGADDTASDDDLHVGDATSFTVSVSPHTTRLLAWDVAPTIEAGHRFGMKVGVKCSSGCDMTGRPFEIFDHADARVASGTLSGDISPGSEGLYYAALDLSAPEAEGLHTWRVEVPRGEGKYPHKAATAPFNVRVVAPAEFTVRIEAWDKEKDAPLPNMSVTMHPYRATTDAQGIAEVRVPKGTYSIFVSGPGYYPVQREMEVAEDVSTRAPLEKEPPQSTVV
jgi:hypothetical protein